MEQRIALLIALIVATLVGIIYLFQIDPQVTSVFGGCAFYKTTGYLCPGCGGTRALHALLHLRVGQALAFNPLILLAIGLLAFLANTIARELVGPRYRIPQVNIPTWLAWAMGIVVVLFGVLRNIPAWPFTLLTP